MALSKDNQHKKPIEWLFNDSYRGFLHILFWAFVYLDEIMAFFGVTLELDTSYFSILIALFIDMIFVYFNIYWLLPNLLLKGKARMYLLITFIMVLINTFIQFYLRMTTEEIQNESWEYLLTIFLGWFVNFGHITGLAVGIKVFKNYILNEVRLKRMETDHLKTELIYLKDQINPHFLFNSLNNIYVLNRKDPDIASDTIILLSDLLRYQLYDCDKERVPLKSEIDYIRNFLELDKLRKDNMDLSFNVKGDINDKMIAPFIFIPFVENAIKHSASTDNEMVYLKINIDTTQKDQLQFFIENSKPSLPLITETGGIGVANVKRRLELVYPKKHQLIITNEKSFYRTSLSVNLN